MAWVQNKHPTSTWVGVIFWSWGVLLSLITERRPNLGQSALELNLSECEWCLIPALDHKRVHWRSSSCCISLPSTRRGAQCLLGTRVQNLEAIQELQLWLQLLLAHNANKEPSEQSQSRQAHWITGHISGPSILYTTMHWSWAYGDVPRVTYKLSIKILVLQP